jgi:ribosomal protein S27AE
MRILSKKSIVKFSAWGWDIVQCPECGQMVVLQAHENLRQSEHWKKHRKSTALSKKSIVKYSAWSIQCPECGQTILLSPNEQLYQSEHWKQYHEEIPEEFQDLEFEEFPEYQDPGFEEIEKFEYPSKDISFGECPHCGSDIGMVEIGKEPYYFCNTCGYVERDLSRTPSQSELFSLPQVSAPPKVQHGPPMSRIVQFLLKKYMDRKDITADQITPNIWLGDIINAWLMRDRQTGRPFDAILNVSQNTYSPPPDVEYVHIPLDEFDESPEGNARRLQDIRRAVETLERWTSEGKNIYVHCREGMNRSPSVIAAYLLKNQLRDLNLTNRKKEKIYSQIIDEINEKRPVAMPEGVMEEAIREYVGLPKVAPRTWMERLPKWHFPLPSLFRRKPKRGILSKKEFHKFF